MRSLTYGGRGARSVPPLTIDLNEPAPICAGDPLSFTAQLTGTPPWNFTLTDGTNNFVHSNITTTPYTFSIIPPPAVTTTYWISSLTDALGYDYSPLETYTVYVSAVPVIADVNVAICTGGTFTVTPVHGGANIVPPGTTYTWPDPVSTPPGAVTGGSAQATGVASISQTLVNTTYATATLEYTVTPTSPCPAVPAGTPFKVIVTVNPKPVPVSIYHY